jgi:uncharacterized protein (TIGR04255 family)
MCEQDLRFMAEAPHFETIHPAHAIERCGMSVVFTEGMPEKAFQRVVASLRSNAEKMGFEQARQSPAIEIDLTTGNLNPVGARQGPVTFVSSDGAFQFIAAPNILFWATTRYVRWAPFAGQFETILGSTLEDYLENLTLGAVQLEYLDRFTWTGGWDDFDVFGVLRRESELLNTRAPRSRREWHLHTGWFEEVDGLRRLVNVNVDVTELTHRYTSQRHPSVAIFTLMKDEANVPGYGTTPSDQLDREFIFERLDRIHSAVKRLFSEVITGAMAERINLDSSDDE